VELPPTLARAENGASAHNGRAVFVFGYSWPSGAWRSGKQAGHEKDREQYQEDKEQDLGNCGCRYRDSGKAENGGNYRYDKEYQGPAKHDGASCKNSVQGCGAGSS
jgi:hypothetical protein